MSISMDFNPRLRRSLRFRLRTLLLAVTLCGAALAVMNAIGPAWSAVLCILCLLATAHVVGNVVGTRLREEATEIAARGSDDRPTFPPVAARPARAKQLSLHSPLGRWIFLLATLGVVGGGTLGEMLFFGHASPKAVIVGTISSAVIGGFVVFLAVSFLAVGLSALWQAHFDKPPPAPPLLKERPTQ